MCLTKEEKQLVDIGNLTDEERERIRNGGCVKKFPSLFIESDKKIELKKEIDISKNQGGCYLLRYIDLNDKYCFGYFNKNEIIELKDIANKDVNIEIIKNEVLNWFKCNRNNRCLTGLIYELIDILKEFKL